MGDYLQMTLNYNALGPQPGIMLVTDFGKTLAKLCSRLYTILMLVGKTEYQTENLNLSSFIN